MLPVYLAVAAVVFLASCAKEYIRYEKKGESPAAPPKKGPQDPCPGKECAGADETRGKGINGSAWVEGKPEKIGQYVHIGDVGSQMVKDGAFKGTTIDASKSIYSVKTLDPNSQLGFKVTTHIPRRAFLFASGQATPSNQSAFNKTITELGGLLVRANSKKYACYLPTTDNSATIYISGHTDRTGSEETNNRLSKARANTVAEAVFRFLSTAAEKDKELDPITIKSIGMGEKMAVEAGHGDDVGNDADRRVDVVTSSTGAPFGNETDWSLAGKIVPPE